MYSSFSLGSLSQWMFFISTSALFFVIGHLYSRSCSCLQESVVQSARSLDPGLFEVESTGTENIEAMASRSFSCNTGYAYDELTNLHHISNELKKRRVKGEANRARTETIIRKTVVAESKEQVFRECLTKMMPELLVVWDKDLKSGNLHKNKYSLNDKAERKKGGITLADLEEAADML